MTKANTKANADVNTLFKGIVDARESSRLGRVKPKKTYKHPQARKIARIKRILEARENDSRATTS